MRFTKQMLKAIRNAEWMNALHDGRVVRYNDGLEFRLFKSVADAEAFCLSLRASDVDAIRLQVPADKS